MADGHKTAVAECVNRVLAVAFEQALREKLFSEGRRPDVEVEVSEISTLETQLRVTWPGTHRRYFCVKVSELM
jgi:hypothetical protein